MGQDGGRPSFSPAVETDELAGAGLWGVWKANHVHFKCMAPRKWGSPSRIA